MRALAALRGVSIAVSLAAAAAALAPVVLPDMSWPTGARDLLDAYGYARTGAENLVSALYLGYRAYDTIGETVVLLAALAGAVALIKTGPGDSLGREGAALMPLRSRRRTEIIDTVSGKLAPIVLLFGCYVMLNGHLSPGGGFQGGVVLASGIVFIAIGRREGGVGGIDPSRRAFDPDTLTVVETIAFASVLLLAFSGVGSGGFTANPIATGGALPPVGFIIAMNVAIGLKVGSGVALLCVLLLRSVSL